MGNASESAKSIAWQERLSEDYVPGLGNGKSDFYAGYDAALSTLAAALAAARIEGAKAMQEAAVKECDDQRDGWKELMKTAHVGDVPKTARDYHRMQEASDIAMRIGSLDPASISAQAAKGGERAE